MTRSDITYQEKFNELKLDVTHPNSQGVNFIFVEGDSDIRTFRKFFDLEKCKVENIPGGNQKLEECVHSLVNIYPLVLGIRDADFIKLEGIPYDYGNMLLTDFHDIEMTIMNNEQILNALIFEYSDKSKSQHVNLRDKILESISLVSCLKWLNYKEDLQLSFKPGFLDLVSFVNLDINIDEYVLRVLSKSPHARITSKDIIVNKVKQLKDLNPDFFQLTNGHDLLNTFAKYFKEVEGRKKVTGESLETTLRIVYDFDTFKETSLYQSIKEWEANNNSEVF